MLTWEKVGMVVLFECGAGDVDVRSGGDVGCCDVEELSFVWMW